MSSKAIIRVKRESRNADKRVLGKRGRMFKPLEVELVAKRSRINAVPRPLTGFPKNKVVTMRYCSYHTLTSTAGVLVSQTYRANSIFDPDASGVGHQPLGRDQWAVFYQQYHVLKSNITLKIQPASAHTTMPVVGVFLTNNVVPTQLDYPTLVEQGETNYRALPQSVATPVVTLKKFFDAKKHFSVADVVDNDDLGAVMAANPTDQAYFVIWCQGTDQATTVAVEVVLVIDYTVLCSDPSELPAS